ncbi:MAG: aldose 1-epimerase [Hyphomicrobiales bacterium]|nr:aldose 1-epimerase [Hyphomicrobiales bacterium]
MSKLIELSAGAARLVLAPTMGGGIARLDHGDYNILRPWSGDEENPFSLASNVLTPFSNRISDGGFTWNGQRYDIAPNLRGEACPIHGDGFQRSWRLERQSGDAIRIELSDGAVGPWNYRACQTFRLSETGLALKLQITNTGDIALPFGCGFHPWFPRDHDTTLTFAADSVWMEDADHLPTTKHDLQQVPDWSFGDSRSLPDGWINNAYSGWSLPAEIRQGAGRCSVQITASDNLTTAIIYSPGIDADFFCFEPVSHPVDAFNLADYPGLTELAPGRSLHGWMRLLWQRI